jgi:polyribonucleotide nucleotidyltransferase
MGLIYESDDKYAILTDIAGLEDHYGDMDFKVAGSKEGITALQMDIKIKKVSYDILSKALHQAREARLYVLEKMLEVLPEPRKAISQYAPRIITLQINPAKIKDLIGPAGRTIKGIIERTGAKINIEQDGSVTIAAETMEEAEAARKAVEEVTQTAEVGKIYIGKVVRIEDYGAFIEILPNVIGLLHISEISHRRIRSVRDVLREGQEVVVKVIAKDEYDRIKLSKKVLEEIEEGEEEEGRRHHHRENRRRGPNSRRRPSRRNER